MAAQILILMALLAMGGSMGSEDPGGRPSNKKVAVGGGGTGDPDTVPREEMRSPVFAKPNGGGGSGDPLNGLGGDGGTGDPDEVDVCGRGGDGGSGDPHHGTKESPKA